MILDLALWTVVVPGGIAVVCAFLARLARPEAPHRGVVAALGPCAGSVAAFLGHAGMPPLPPIDTMAWIPIIALAAFAMLSPLDFLPPRLAPLGWLAAAGLGAGAAYLVGRPAFSQSGVALAAGVAATAAGAALAAAAADRAPGRLPAWALLGSLLLGAAAASAASLLRATALFAALFGAVAAVLGGLLVVGLVFRSLVASRAVVGVAVLVLSAELLYVQLYAGLSRVSAALLGASLLAPLAALLLPAPVSQRTRAFVSLALSAALGAGAVALSGALAPPYVG
jgi:hypothetical protein